MFLNLRNVVAAALIVTSTLSAQYSRSGTYSRTIGNSWLGGNVSVTAALNTTTTSTVMSTTRAANASVTAAADANVLTHRFRAAQLTFSARNSVTQYNTMGTPSQNATASFRLQLAGYNVWDRSVTSTGNLGGIPARTYNLFPQDVSAPVGVGPFTIRLGGNAGVTLGAGALVVFPTTTPEVRLILSGNTAVVGRAHVSVGAVGFYAGLELQARFAEQRLTISLIANALNGLSGMCSYEIRAISLRLIAYLEAFWTRVYSTTLTSWGSTLVSRDLLNL